MHKKVRIMSSTAAFPWTDAYLLGYTPMDNTHREFVVVVDALMAADDADFAQRLEAFRVHAETHFEQERSWMAATTFPAMACHVDEHNAVLKSVHEVQAQLAAGVAVANARGLVDALVDWFPGHADYMDAPLAQWMVRQRMGGTPIVLKRGILNTDAELSTNDAALPG